MSAHLFISGVDRDFTDTRDSTVDRSSSIFYNKLCHQPYQVSELKQHDTLGKTSFLLLCLVWNLLESLSFSALSVYWKHSSDINVYLRN